MANDKPVELALDLLEWRETRLKLDALESAIVEKVLKMGKTQTVGDVRATYSKGRAVYDYETAAKNASDVTVGIVTKHSTFVEQIITPSYTVTDWRAICKEAKVDGIQTNEPTPSVKVKFVKT